MVRILQSRLQTGNVHHLTILSLGTRVVLAYALAAIPSIGVHGIWWSIPIGWALADIYGWMYYWRKNKEILH